MTRHLLRRLGPWAWVLMAAEAGLITRRHWTEVPVADRARLRALVAQSGGRPDRLAPAEREELMHLMRGLRLGKLAWALGMGLVRPGRQARRRG